MARSRCLVAVWLLLTAAILTPKPGPRSQLLPRSRWAIRWRRSIAGGKSRWATRRLIRGLEEREVLQEAELSRQADSENNLGGCSETMYYICPPNFQLLSRIAFSGPYTRNHGNHLRPAGV